ncbi:tRNA (adenosine(37)-N6)-threonylcarbamoyltransferase complex dimerization subunit type 1 TsaB [Belliella sp. DSM 107340]|uniref:tRNA (Adenosine(37)-N6)-threonylcarbamoyltransferase complex dimerization subunit type 1 TsaB n=1 Tax=Belliella calami TaxID=2923436 RepID=A0ABS9UTP1_9BACT|nr:tRNA (adenosine(37)-N6)-threonylcarbamoyltransferase complex dimerization subunit type 1 TsaB [Belliella calami]MCH7399991.1 tRNA (adenosine(37)-N6)-threonylcarbamoyltransferase complex dimerization subunit type 1 TsaB [Belliella calami]
MALILSIETATQVCSVSVHKDGLLLGVNEVHLNNVHSQKLMGVISNLMNQLDLVSKDLDAVAVSCGPGSYTGLRIGVSIAKGFSFAIDIPLIAVGTLEALAFQAIHLCLKDDYVIPMIDARRMEVYASVLDFEGKVVKAAEPVVLESNPFEEYLTKGNVYFLGDGMAKSKDILDHPNSRFLPFSISSKTVGELAYKKFVAGDFEDLAYFEPNYLKEFRVLQSKKNPFLV